MPPVGVICNPRVFTTEGMSHFTFMGMRVRQLDAVFELVSF